MAYGDLPDGVYEKDGKYYHDIKRGPNRQPDGSFKYDIVPRECAFPLTLDVDEIHKAREAAARKGLDFYDPRKVEGHVIGWLANGRKRSIEWPANLGAGEVRYTQADVPTEENPDIAAGIAPVPVGAGGKASIKNG